MKIDSKKRLLELKEEDEQRKADVSNNPGAMFGSVSAEGDLSQFLGSIAEGKGDRKQQLEIIQDFFQHPEKYGIETDLIPTSTEIEEVEERRSELQYRIDLLRSVLKAMESEMGLLTQVKLSDANGVEKSAAALKEPLPEKGAVSK